MVGFLTETRKLIIKSNKADQNLTFKVSTKEIRVQRATPVVEKPLSKDAENMIRSIIKLKVVTPSNHTKFCLTLRGSTFFVELLWNDPLVPSSFLLHCTFTRHYTAQQQVHSLIRVSRLQLEVYLQIKVGGMVGCLRDHKSVSIGIL